MSTEVDDIMAELGLGDPLAPPSGSIFGGTALNNGKGANEEVDALLAELGIESAGAVTSASYGLLPDAALKPQQGAPTSAATDEVDGLLEELGISIVLDEGVDPATAMHAVPTDQLQQQPAPLSAGPGMSAGPGAMRPGMSAGPGAMRPGMSAGPGAMRPGMSAGPGAARSSGPGATPVRPPGKPRTAPPRPVKPKLATHTPDGRELTYDGPPCAYCNDTVIGSVMTALGKNYHPECFVCSDCFRQFPNGQFIDNEGSPFCEHCYNDLFAPKCEACAAAITDKCISIGDKKFHVPHFLCGGCGVRLAGQKFKEEDGEVFCMLCKDKRRRRIAPPSRTCGKCKKNIVGEFITLRGIPYHASHFRCEECGCNFVGGNCREWQGKLYCQEDYDKMMKDVCGFCHKPIIGRSVTGLGRVFHPACFVCTHCREPFLGSSNFMERDGKPYCQLHWHQLFGYVCAKCDRPIIGKVIRACGKAYHLEHFTCSSCDVQLGGQVFEYETKPMCKKCFSKLPADVRKRIEKKRKAQLEAEKKRRAAAGGE